MPTSPPNLKLPEEQPHSLAPSMSTAVSVGAGLPAAVLISWGLGTFFHVQLPPEVSACLGTLVSAAAGYFGKGGKAINTTG